VAVTTNQIRVEASIRQLLVTGDLAIGSRLPPFPVLAKRLETSVAVLQQVIPRLVAEGLLTVSPRVGTFVRAAAAAPRDALAGSVLRLQVSEAMQWSSPGWRAVASAFEAAHAGVKVEIGHTPPGEPDPWLRTADVELVQSAEIAVRLRQRRYATWAKSGVWCGEDRLRSAQLLATSVDISQVVPVLISHAVLLVGRRDQELLKPWPAELDELLDRCDAQADDSGRYGLVIEDPVAPLRLLGLGQGRLAEQTADLDAWLTRVATCGAPQLVLPDDVSDEVRAHLVLHCLASARARLLLSHLWRWRYADHSAWSLHPCPGTSPVPTSAIYCMVPDGARAGQAGELARFIAGPQGQDVLARSEALLPSWAASAARHPHAHLVADAERRGYETSNSLTEAASARAAILLSSLRVARIGQAEARAGLLRIDRTLSR